MASTPKDAAPQRRNLAALLDDAEDVTPAPIAATAVEAVAKSQGYRKLGAEPAPVAAAPAIAAPAPVVSAPVMAPTEDAVPRRILQRKGRDYPVNVRLSFAAKTMLVDEANSRQVPQAQVIEEALLALKASREQR